MRPKLNHDVFYLSVKDGVQFRNVKTQFIINGQGVYPLVAKIAPFLTGEYELNELLLSIPDGLVQTVNEIVNVLLTQGFLRDVTDDLPHNLSEKELTRFSSTIRYIDFYVTSPEQRFESFRRSNYCIVATGTALPALIHAAYEAGAQQVSYFSLDPITTDVDNRIEDIFSLHVEHDDSLILTKVVDIDATNFDALLYVPGTADLAMLQTFQAKTVTHGASFAALLPFRNTILIGPVTSKLGGGCVECAWRRLYGDLTVETSPAPISPTAYGLQAHLIWLELLRSFAGIKRNDGRSQFHLLNPETLQSQIHTLTPHPFCKTCQRVDNVVEATVTNAVVSTDTISETVVDFFDDRGGVLLRIEQGELKQTPLFQSRVVYNHPSNGSYSSVESSVVASGFTNFEARLDAVYSAIEAYSETCLEQSEPGVVSTAVGCGESVEVARIRGLLRAVEKLLSKEGWPLNDAKEISIDDQNQAAPRLVRFLEIHGCSFAVYGTVHFTGLPVAHVIVDGVHHFQAAHLSLDQALAKVFQRAVEFVQNKPVADSPNEIETVSVSKTDASYAIASMNHVAEWDDIVQTLQKNGYLVDFSPVMQDRYVASSILSGPFRVDLSLARKEVKA